MSWTLLSIEFAIAVHDEQLREHGGLSGTRDQGLLESALARAQSLIDYGQPSAFDISACYAHGIAKNHPFIDGNKRTAFVFAETFLALNGFELLATDEQCFIAMLRLAAGDDDQDTFAEFLRVNSQRVELDA
jgi:death on curing protein